MSGLTDYHANVLGLDPSTLKYIAEDFVAARITSSSTVYVLAYGDPIIVEESAANETRIRIVGGRFHDLTAVVKGDLPTLDRPIFKFSMVDVQQGDGMIVETPGGKIVLIDGGDNQLFARHLAARFTGTSAESPLRVDAMIVTHGDADHFEGLAEIRASEKLRATRDEPTRERKRLFVAVDRVLHNGLVKRPTSLADGSRRAETQMFGDVMRRDDDLYCVELVDDLLDVPETQMNLPFRRWTNALRHWSERQEITCARVSHVNHQMLTDLFADEEMVGVEVLGPVEEDVAGSPGLPFLRAPRKSTELHLSEEPAVTGSFSASHTINGHSIAMRLACGNVRFLLTGDWNQQAMARLRSVTDPSQFECEILKAPHHGSHDFDFEVLEQARPVVSLISSGDESSNKEHIHPRATLVSALGRVSRGKTGVIFITELAAFFNMRGPAVLLDQSVRATAEFDPTKPFFAFERTNFGIVHIRTDGKRVLAFTHSGKRGVNEGYAFNVADDHSVEWLPRLTIRSAPT